MYVLIPAYQPDARLPRLILELHRADPATKIVVVDDRSGQKFSDIFEAAATAGAHVISYENNRGKGYALREGFTWIRDGAGNPQECVVTAHADGQHLNFSPVLASNGLEAQGHADRECAHSRSPCFPRCLRSRGIVTSMSSVSFCTRRSSVSRSPKSQLRRFTRPEIRLLTSVPCKIRLEFGHLC